MATRLFLVEKKNPDMKISLGVYKANDEATAVCAAQKRHKNLLGKMQTKQFVFYSERVAGPYRREKSEPVSKKQEILF